MRENLMPGNILMRPLEFIAWLPGIVLFTHLMPAMAATTADSASSASAEALQIIRDCSFDAPPKILDGVSASRVEMEAMASAVRAYVDGMQASLACLDAALEEVGPADRQIITYLYNNGVDQLNFVAGEYNEQVRINKRFEGFDIP